MKKISLAILLIFLLVFVVTQSACKKKGEQQPGDGKEYRVTSSAFYNAQNIMTERDEYFYA